MNISFPVPLVIDMVIAAVGAVGLIVAGLVTAWRRRG